MHSAPTVSYPVGRSRLQGWLVGLAGLGGVLLCILWIYAADSTGWRQWALIITLLGTSALAGQAWRQSPQGRLCWDGLAWDWQTANTSISGTLAVHLDLQVLLLVSLRTEPGARIWLWPERGVDAARWNALRRAVFSRAGMASGRLVSTRGEQTPERL